MDVMYFLELAVNGGLAGMMYALVAMGIDSDRAEIIEDFIRTRDRDRIAIQQAEGIYAGIDLLRKRPTMTPFSEPQREAKPLNPEADEIIREEEKVD